MWSVQQQLITADIRQSLDSLVAGSYLSHGTNMHQTVMLKLNCSVPFGVMVKSFPSVIRARIRFPVALATGSIFVHQAAGAVVHKWVEAAVCTG